MLWDKKTYIEIRATQRSREDHNDGDHERPATAMACSSGWEKRKDGGDDGGSDERAVGAVSRRGKR